MSALVSGEGVSIELGRAGLGSRIIATLIDLAAQLALLIALQIIDALFATGDDAITAALILVELVFVLAGYPIVFEWLTRGKTLGKMAMGLRVVRDDGGPIGFRQALVRGLSGFLLEKPGIAFPPVCTAVAMITLASSSEHKRIGDMMAGTFVVNERAGPRTALTPVPFYVPPALYGWAQSLDLTGLNDQLALQLRQFVLRAGEMTPAAQYVLGTQFRDRVVAVISPAPPPGVPTPTLLTTVLAERRRRADLQRLPLSNQPYASVFPAPAANRPPMPDRPAGPFAPPS
jgi:uncharacterized RDD family membrane protein YckC